MSDQVPVKGERIHLDSQMDEHELRRLVEHPPEGWYRLTVRFENHDGAIFREVKTLISRAELDGSTGEELAERHVAATLAAMKADL